MLLFPLHAVANEPRFSAFRKIVQVLLDVLYIPVIASVCIKRYPMTYVIRNPLLYSVNIIIKLTSFLNYCRIIACNIIVLLRICQMAWSGEVGFRIRRFDRSGIGASIATALEVTCLPDPNH